LYLVKKSDRVQRLFSSIYILEVKMSNQPLMSLILKGLALAMGVAAAVLSILGTSSPDTLVTLLGIGLFSLAIWALQQGQ
jgi:hypothetical protein